MNENERDLMFGSAEIKARGQSRKLLTSGNRVSIVQAQVDGEVERMVGAFRAAIRADLVKLPEAVRMQAYEGARSYFSAVGRLQRDLQDARDRAAHAGVRYQDCRLRLLAISRQQAESVSAEIQLPAARSFLGLTLGSSSRKLQAKIVSIQAELKSLAAAASGAGREMREALDEFKLADESAAKLHMEIRRALLECLSFVRGYAPVAPRRMDAPEGGLSLMQGAGCDEDKGSAKEVSADQLRQTILG